MTCQFANGKRCLIAERISQAPVTIRTDKACECCLASTEPRGTNMVTLSLAVSSLHINGDHEGSLKIWEKYRPWREANVSRDTPTLAKRVLTWRASIRRWEEAGKPVRSDDEVKRIISEYCEPCKHYNPIWHQCKLCGCFCRKQGNAKFNKPKMLTERCPLDPPKWGGNNTPLPTMVVVAGPPRTGTSCVAGMLHLLGVPMGKSLLKPNRNNPKGYYEDETLLRFVMSLTEAQKTKEDIIEWFRVWANTRREATVVGCKHSQLCNLLPHMTTVWPSLKVIVTDRPIVDACDSLERANWGGRQRLRELQQLHHQREHDLAQLKIAALRLEYRHIVQHPEATVDEIIRFVGITPTAEQRQAAIDHVDPSLCHINPPSMATGVSVRPRVFTFWTGRMPPIIQLCLESMRRNIPDIEVWTLRQWKKVYDGCIGPWEKIKHLEPNVQSDILRYWLLNTYGGIWLDADYIAFRDIRSVWDHSADYIGYLEPRSNMPYTALMGGHPNSPVMQTQLELAQVILSHNANGLNVGPILTLMALRACPGSNVVMVPRELIHPILWGRRAYSRLHNMVTPYVFSENAYGLMLLGKTVVRKHRSWSRRDLLDDYTVIGQAFRRALGEQPSYWMTSNANDYTPKSGVAEWSVTYQCDLKCTNCSRLGYLPSHVAPMTLGDAREFERQCRDINWRPRLIQITGGEPTLHPDVIEFCRIAQELCPGKVNIWSNAYSDNARRVLDIIRKENIANIITDTHKRNGSIEQPIKDTCISPADFGKHREPCRWHTSRAIHCGVSVDHDGYTVCPNGGVYNAILKLGIATHRLADLFNPDFACMQTKALCRHCGMLYSDSPSNLSPDKHNACTVISGVLMSTTWQHAISDAKE